MRVVISHAELALVGSLDSKDAVFSQADASAAQLCCLQHEASLHLPHALMSVCVLALLDTVCNHSSLAGLVGEVKSMQWAMKRGERTEQRRGTKLINIITAGEGEQPL